MSFYEPPKFQYDTADSSPDVFTGCCKEHKNCKLTFFCNGHWMLCCARCREKGGVHEKCNVVPFKDVDANLVRGYLPEAIRKLEALFSNQTSNAATAADIERKQCAFEQSLQDARSAILSKFQAIEAKKNQLLAELDNIERSNSCHDSVARFKALQQKGAQVLNEGKRAATAWDSRIELEMVHRTSNVYCMANELEAEQARLAQTKAPSFVVTLSQTVSQDNIENVFGSIGWASADSVTVKTPTPISTPTVSYTVGGNDGNTDTYGVYDNNNNNNSNNDDDDDDDDDDASRVGSGTIRCNFPWCGLVFGSKKELDNHIETFGHHETIRVLVCNLAYTVTNKDLQREFAQFNPCDVKIAIRKGGKSKGYALVFFNRVEDCDAAVAALNGKELAGRNIKVSKPNKSTSDYSTTSFGSSSAGSAVHHRQRRNTSTLKDTLFVGRLPDVITDEGLKEIFEGCAFTSARSTRVRRPSTAS